MVSQSLEKSSTNPEERLERAYKGRHSSRQVPVPTDLSPDTVTTNPFDPNREIIQRVKYVMDAMLKMVPPSGQKDVRYIALKTMLYESLKDLARVKDEEIIGITQEMANALMFISQGTMAELQEMLELQDAGDQ